MYSGGEVDKNSFSGWRNYTQDQVMEKSLLSVSQDVKLLNENIVEYTVVKPLRKILKKRDIKWKMLITSYLIIHLNFSKINYMLD